MAAMVALSLALVVYAGVVGPHAERAERQLGSLLHHDAGIEPVELSPARKRALGHGSGKADDVVRSLDTDGVVAGEVIEGKRARRLRVLVYDHAGDVVSEIEVPLDGDSLTRAGISLLRKAVVRDAAALAEAPAAEEPVAEEPAAEEPAAEAPAAEEPVAADVEATASREAPLHLGASAGLGLLSRRFQADSPALPGYQATAVPAIRLVGELEPTRRLRLEFVHERSLGMVSLLERERAATQVTRWSVHADWRLVDGRFSLAPVLGVGQRRFTIDSKSPARSPDGDYLYLATGLRLGLRLSARARLAAGLEVQPVVSGEQAGQDAHGRAVRVGLDAGLGLDVVLGPWLLLRAEAGWQQFAWTFADAGDASDRYASATLSLGARY